MRTAIHLCIANLEYGRAKNMPAIWRWWRRRAVQRSAEAGPMAGGLRVLNADCRLQTQSHIHWHHERCNEFAKLCPLRAMSVVQSCQYVAIMICMPYYYLSILWCVREMVDINFIWCTHYRYTDSVFRASEIVSSTPKRLAVVGMGALTRALVRRNVLFGASE